MLSKSQKSSSKIDLIIVGNSWTAPVFADAIRDSGIKSRILSYEKPHSGPPALPLYIGNGESLENATRVMGKEMVDLLWDISTRNFQTAHETCKRLGWKTHSAKAIWHAKNGTTSEEPFLCLRPNKTTIESADEILAVRREATFSYQLNWIKDGKTHIETAPIVLFATDWISKELLPSIQDKWIPVTLSSFLFESAKELTGAAFFNGGADFAFSVDKDLLTGSFRNLYEDKAVGFHDTPDPVTEKNVGKFFSKLGWIRNQKKSFVSLESISCDGLPLVGTLSDMPGVYFVGGFAGHTPNFIFEIASILAKAIIKGQKFDDLRLFSTRRFV